MAARTRKIRHDAETRLKIKTSQLINRLTAHALGEIELQPTQIRAIEILLKKALPDLASTDVNVNDNRDIRQWSTSELVGFLESRRAGAEEASSGPDESDSVH